MDSNQLFKYVYAKYGLKFQPAVPGSTSIYVLMSPVDSGYFAMLSRSQNQTVLDLKCGSMAALLLDLPGYTEPQKIKASDWVGAILGSASDDSLKKALDLAFKLAMNGDEVNIAQDQYFYIAPDKVDNRYQAQKIKLRENFRKKHNTDFVPDRIKKMLAIYDYSILPSRGRAKNFYQQAKLMADYDDNYSEFFAFKRFYPTYHDMNTEQLRSYFTWRSKIRQHVFEKTSTPYAFVYIYELLNNIGVADPQAGYGKLLEFEENYVQKFDLSIDVYLQDWLKDYVLYYGLDEKLLSSVLRQRLNVIMIMKFCIIRRIFPLKSWLKFLLKKQLIGRRQKLLIKMKLCLLNCCIVCGKSCLMLKNMALHITVPLWASLI